MSCLQNAFFVLANSQILYSFFSVNEVIGSLLERNACGVICKLDVQKIYNYVNWNFLFLFGS